MELRFELFCDKSQVEKLNFRRATPKPAYVAESRPNERSECRSFFATQKTSACSNGFALIFVENTAKTPFWRWLFWYFFAIKKVRRK